MFTVLAVAHSNLLQHQLKVSTPVLHRLSHHFFPCISHVVVPEVELGQDRVDLQRLRDRLGTLGPDSVLFEADSVLFEAQGLVRSLLKSLIR